MALDCSYLAIIEALDQPNRPDALEIVRTIFLFLAAFGTYLIAWVNARAARRRRTIDLIQSTVTNSEILARTGRIYCYRRKNKGYPDPYVGVPGISISHDIICILNFFESICIEIDEKMVKERHVREHLEDIIAGLDPLFEELKKQQGSDTRNKFPRLMKYITRWQPNSA